jgi:hypothetical protein
MAFNYPMLAEAYKVAALDGLNSPPSYKRTIGVVVGTKPLVCQLSAGHSIPVRPKS